MGKEIDEEWQKGVERGNRSILLITSHHYLWFVTSWIAFFLVWMLSCPNDQTNLMIAWFHTRTDINTHSSWQHLNDFIKMSSIYSLSLSLSFWFSKFFSKFHSSFKLIRSRTYTFGHNEIISLHISKLIIRRFVFMCM